MARKLKAAIIGAGDIGFRYSLDPLRTWVSSHLQAYKEHPNFEPVAVCDIDKTKLTAVKSALPFLNTYTSWDEMLKREKIDILSVCASPKINLKVCGSPFLRNTRALILEKPLAENIRDGREIIKSLRSKRLITAVNYFRRWQVVFNKAKVMIDSGTIGKVLKIDAFYPKGIFSGGSHLIDILHYLFGNFTTVRALSANESGAPRPKGRGSLLKIKSIPQIPIPAWRGALAHPIGQGAGLKAGDFAEGIKPAGEALYSVFGRIGGIEVFLSGFDKRDFNIFEIVIWGSKGRIAISDFGKRLTLWRASESGFFSGQKELLIKKESEIKKDDYFLNMLDNISNALENKQEKILCAPEDALKVVVVIKAILDSYKYEKEISLTWR